MKIIARTAFFLTLILSAVLSAWGAPQQSGLPAPVSASNAQALDSFAAFRPIDAHVHVFKTDPAFQAMLERLHLTVLNIIVVDDTRSDRKHLQPQLDFTAALLRSSHGHVALGTTFDPYRFNDASFSADAIKQLDENFAAGALAAKVWKNIGMEIKNRDGEFVMPDDPKLEPIYQDIAKHDKTLLSHAAEPDAAWGPPDPSDPSSSYYQENPQWARYNKPGFASKQTILQARDRMLAAHPQLRVVGVHLGSMEKDIDNIARHLEQYPNFAVDTGARMEYLMMAPTDKVRAFLIKYQDRVLYGTDIELLATDDVAESLKDWESIYVRDWKFLATDEVFDSGGRKVHGLKLPEPVLRKIFRENAVHWIHGL